MSTLKVVSKKIEPPPALEIQGLKAVSINTFCPIGLKGDVLTWIIAAAGYLIIVLNAPLEHHNKRLTFEQKHKYMIISTVLGISSMLISFMLNIMGMVIRYGEYTILCHISLYINTMLLIIGLLLLLGMRKEGRFHETDS